MESRTEGSNSEVTSKPEAVHSGSASTTDSIILPITGHKLNGQNFIQWAQSVRIFICGKGKEEYLTRAIVQPKEDDPGYRTWKLENSMVMSWLINSMTNDIGENFMYYGTTKEIWDAARETYSNIDNTSAIFEIKSILQDLRQGDSTVTEYFNILTRYWQQLDIYEELVWKCPEDGLLYKKVIEKERIYKFLLGLNKNLDEVRGRVLSIKPLLVFREVFFLNSQRGKQTKSDVGNPKSSKNLENSTLVARGTQSNNINHQTKKNRPWCDHCRKPGHMKETCWHLHGKPADWKPSRPQQNREGQGYTATAEGDTSGTSSNPGPFSKRQLEALQKMFQQTLQSTGTTIGTTSVAQKGLELWKEDCNAEVCVGLYLLRVEEIQRLPMKTTCVVSNPSTKTDSVVIINNITGSRWFVTFVDDHTRVTWVFLMKKKSEVREIFENFNNMVQTQFQAKIQVLRTDNAREYYHNILGSYLLENGIVHQSSCIDTPQQNGVAERKNRHLMENFQAFITSLEDDRIPSNIQEALQQPEWKTAVQEEIQALEKNGTWEISELPEGKRPVGCKWIFTVKHNPYGSINSKAQLHQSVIVSCSKLDWNLHQLDVKNAFLNGELEEEVYMKIPPSMETPENSRKVCKLRKSLYGLKPSPRAWFDQLTRVVKKHGFIQCQADHTLFMKHSKEGEMTLFIVYVDDIIITGDDEEGIGNLKKLLAREFEIKDLGQLRYFLGMEVGRTKEGIVVTQRKYVLDLLQETGMLGCKPVDTPMDPIGKIDKDNDSHPTDKDSYQRLVGKLIYLTHSRPDIGFAVSMVSRYMNNPIERHMKAIYRILQYLKKSPGRGLYFKKTSSREVEVFTDADWAGSLTDRRSTTGYCSYVWGNLVTWRSKKQSVVARSSAEAEFRAMAHGICERMWLQRILKELGIISNSTMTVLCDNKATISIAKNPVQHNRTKHVEIDRHFIKEKLEGGTIRLMYIPSSRQTTNILTKALPKATYENMKSKLGMLDIYYPT
ncbi:Retrovirus-related Pol polyprotein from transposon RE1 [Vitis vinifera]|uniref:Retrovirus-related Pol polyprotein from transposon RE1 n=1 Tax=Vitis vinifera TaxID=29760 RepID=A0A438FI26_VITVI|nr:Retrovirus-related Pol polyprotein from transposon RE1 [Vitis vinifera]